MNTKENAEPGSVESTAVLGLAQRRASAGHNLLRKDMTMRTTIARVVDTLKALVGRGEFPHAYNCFQHGGSGACEKSNRRLGFKCPKCAAPNARLHRTSEAQHNEKG